jgi:flagellar basal-body rod protein FlgB
MLNSGDNSTKSIDLMHRAMSFSVLRAQVLDNNIANVTTPNYKRKDVTFQQELLRAINSEKEEDKVPFKTTREKHISINRPKDYREVKSKVITEYNTYQNNNGNSVDIDKEMMEESKNAMYFNAMAQRVAKEFNKLKYLLRS